MTVITENHPKWPVYSQLPKCGEITASADGALFGLNCSHCRAIFRLIDAKDFLRHQQEQHAQEQGSTVGEQQEQGDIGKSNRKRKMCSDAQADGECVRKTSRLDASPTPATAVSFEIADASAALKQEVDCDVEDVKAEPCVFNVATADPLDVAESSANELVIPDAVYVKEEVGAVSELATAEEPTESDSHSLSDSSEVDDKASAAHSHSNSKEHPKDRNIADQLLAMAVIYERYSLLWDLDNDENHNRTRQRETQLAMLLEVSEKMGLTLTLAELRNRIRLLRKYHAADKRKRLKAERCKMPFVPIKPLLYPKLQFLEPFVGPYRCEKCHEKISQYMQMQAHRAAHDGQQQNQCSICQRQFKDLSHMLVHKRRHDGVKPHVCTICGLGFFYAKELLAHRTIHTGEKQCMCHICGAEYRTMPQLNRHKYRRHNPDRPRYQCAQCPKSFKEKVMLNGHMNTHLEVRNAVCPVCGKAFYVRKTLRQHMLIHEQEKRYQCDLCDKKFAQMAGLCTHRKTQHNIIKA